MLNKEIENYINDHTSPEEELLSQLNRETHLKVTHPRMLSGHVQGKFLEMISHMVQPKRILEIGTYTAYASICLARGLKENGRLITIEVDPEIFDFAKAYINKAKLGGKIDQKLGRALHIIPSLEGPFDLVFIDADKENYLNYYQLIFEKVKPGGYILADNALWDGKVVGNSNNTDKDTKAIVAFNDFIQQDKRVENILLPLRDGIMMIRKI
jgi:predicted O-methyltransferase YrrM